MRTRRSARRRARGTPGHLPRAPSARAAPSRGASVRRGHRPGRAAPKRAHTLTRTGVLRSFGVAHGLYLASRALARQGAGGRAAARLTAVLLVVRADHGGLAALWPPPPDSSHRTSRSPPSSSPQHPRLPGPPRRGRSRARPAGAGHGAPSRSPATRRFVVLRSRAVLARWPRGSERQDLAQAGVASPSSAIWRLAHDQQLSYPCRTARPPWRTSSRRARARLGAVWLACTRAPTASSTPARPVRARGVAPHRVRRRWGTPPKPSPRGPATTRRSPPRPLVTHR
jgi:hypothetical protein